MVQRTVCSWAALLLLVLVVGITATHAAPVNTKENSTTNALEYLVRHGYIKANTTDISAGRIRADALTSAIREFQNFTGLSATGQLDEATHKKMIRPRCGVKDVIPRGNSTSTKRYSFLGSTWNKRHLTYTILNRPHYLESSAVFNEIARAFNVWSDHVDLTFTPVSGDYKPDIQLLFASGEHGDNDPFDGPGRTVAHAYQPQIGQVHFDNDEQWTINSYRGTNLFQVAAHEIGHALGLGHSHIEAALMYEHYLGYQPNFSLHLDDIVGIQRLYGPKTRTRG